MYVWWWNPGEFPCHPHVFFSLLSITLSNVLNFPTNLLVLLSQRKHTNQVLIILYVNAELYTTSSVTTLFLLVIHVICIQQYNSTNLCIRHSYII